MKKLGFLVLLALVACKKSESGERALPPATGDGAPPLPEIPDLEPTSFDAGVAAGSPEPAAPARLTGTLEARAEVKVGPKTSGTIVALAVDEGSTVKQGDLLFRLDTGDAVLMRRQAQTALAGAKVQLAAARREHERMSRLVAENAMPRAQLDHLQSQVDGAEIAIASAKNQLAVANKMIADATVRAPRSGVVLHRLMSVGEYATMMPPSPVVVLQDQSTLELRFSIPTRLLTEVRPGDAVTVTIDSLGRRRRAAVSQIAPIVDARTRTIEVTALLENCDGALVPGMMAEVALGGVEGGAAVEEVTCPAPAPPAKARPRPRGPKGKAR